MSPSTSEKQRRLMCLALSMKRGKTPISASDEAAKLVNTMTEKQLSDYCGSKVEK